MNYKHVPLNEEISAIGGRYLLIKEEKLNFRGREVFYLVGCGITDTACCGVSGIAYISVPGFVVEWKSQHSPEGTFISQVEAISDSELQHEIKLLLQKREALQQVQFQ
ncbi:hypothetical protein WDW89_05425 [Deltaproteobacteria bacterium TL4]